MNIIIINKPVSHYVLPRFQDSHPQALISYSLPLNFLSLPQEVGFSSRKMFFLVHLWNVLGQKQGHLWSTRIYFGHRQHPRETGERAGRAHKAAHLLPASGGGGGGNLIAGEGARWGWGVERRLAGSSSSLFSAGRRETLLSSPGVCSSGPLELMKPTLCGFSQGHRSRLVSWE